MNWQDMAALAIVGGVAVGWMALLWRRRAQPHKGGVCGGCCQVSRVSPPPSIEWRARKGQPPVIKVRLR